jgi:hypothetical protein
LNCERDSATVITEIDRAIAVKYPDATISPEDQRSIDGARVKFLENRDSMIAALAAAPVPGTPWKRAVVIDAVIEGSISHLVEVGRDKGNHQAEIGEEGDPQPSEFSGYASHWADVVCNIFLGLGAKQTGGTVPPHRRAVGNEGDAGSTV